MRIAFLCKRRYMSKDVILDRYARLYEIPHQLALLGHEVLGLCMSYQNAAPGRWVHDAAPGTLQWESHAAGRTIAPALALYPGRMLRRLRAFRPDVLVGASDIPHAVLTAWLARRLGVPYAIDLYDNFEGFGQARIPGFVPALRQAVRQAGLVTTTSALLQAMVQQVYQAKGKVVAMPSTIDQAVFYPLDQQQCRQALRLPLDAVLVGTAGGLMQERGIGDLYQAWEQLSATRPELHLVLAGPTDAKLPPPQHPRVHYLGMLAHADTAKLLGALDVGVIYLRDTPFGRFCFPQKAYEMQACRLPVVATNVGVMPHLLATVQQALYQEGSAPDLVRALEFQLAQRALPDLPVEDWRQVVGHMEQELRALVKEA